MNLKTRILYYLIWIIGAPFLALLQISRWVAETTVDALIDLMTPAELNDLEFVINEGLAAYDALLAKHDW